MGVISDIKQYFCIEEFVDEQVYRLYGESAWRFIDRDLLEVLLVIREQLDRPITINNWKWGGVFSQRGLRHNQSDLVKSKNRIYLSAHMFGKAIDFDVKGITACEVREWLEDNQDLLPCPIRLERNLKGKPISWVHLDVIDPGQGKVYLFDV